VIVAEYEEPLPEKLVTINLLVDEPEPDELDVTLISPDVNPVIFSLKLKLITLDVPLRILISPLGTSITSVGAVVSIFNSFEELSEVVLPAASLVVATTL
jgi:hypothetical protein